MDNETGRGKEVLMTFFVGQPMPPPACTPDGKCKECGEASGSHKGTCDWSIMRSGQLWIPQPWSWTQIVFEQEKGDINESERGI